MEPLMAHRRENVALHSGPGYAIQKKRSERVKALDDGSFKLLYDS